MKNTVFSRLLRNKMPIITEYKNIDSNNHLVGAKKR